MKNDEPDALDRALDKPLDNALAQYSSEEPLAGLEQRVLNRVRAEGAPPRSGFGRRVAAAGVAVVAGVGVGAGLWGRAGADRTRAAGIESGRGGGRASPIGVRAPGGGGWGCSGGRRGGGGCLVGQASPSPTISWTGSPARPTGERSTRAKTGHTSGF